MVRRQTTFSFSTTLKTLALVHPRQGAVDRLRRARRFELTPHRLLHRYARAPVGKAVQHAAIREDAPQSFAIHHQEVLLKPCHIIWASWLFTMSAISSSLLKTSSSLVLCKRARTTSKTKDVICRVASSSL
jgi:hypothetical protein